MSFICYVLDCYNKFFKESKYLLKLTYCILIMLLFSALIISSMGEMLFNDADTVQYWLNEIFISCNTIFRCAVFPIILFEIFIHK